MYPKKNFRGKILEMLLQKTFCKGPFVKSVTDKNKKRKSVKLNKKKLQITMLCLKIQIPKFNLKKLTLFGKIE